MRANVTFVCDLMTISVSLADVDINESGLSVVLDDTYVAAEADEMIRSHYGFSPLKFSEDVIIEYIDDAEYDTIETCDECGAIHDPDDVVTIVDSVIKQYDVGGSDE